MSKHYAIDLDVRKCVSCGACAVACMDQNDLDVKGGRRPFRNVFGTTNCIGCHSCVMACPYGALRRLIDLDGPKEIVPELSLRQRSMEMLSKQV